MLSRLWPWRVEIDVLDKLAKRIISKLIFPVPPPSQEGCFDGSARLGGHVAVLE